MNIPESDFADLVSPEPLIHVLLLVLVGLKGCFEVRLQIDNNLRPRDIEPAIFF